MLLERRLVSKLENYNILHGNRIEFLNFLGHVVNTSWPRWNYCFDSRGEFAKRLTHIFGDCVEEGYIQSQNEQLSVTRKGRSFVSWSGFCEEYIKRRKRFTTALKAVLLSSTLTALIVHFWPEISAVFKQ